METKTKGTTKSGDHKGSKGDKQPKAEKAPKVARSEVTKMDLVGLAGKPHCELWTKKGIDFDHATVTVQAHVLFFTGDTPRKLCFNTYNGSLGRKSGELPVDSFLKDEAIAGKKPWFPVADLDKARAKLQSSGYHKVQPRTS